MKNIKKILIGTHNIGKFREISYLLNKNIKKISPVSIKIKSPKETGKTFSENAKLKAEYFCKKSKLLSISDDSGLSVNCLDGKPGIYSARMAKKCGSFNKAMHKIIQQVSYKNKNKKIKNMRADFICSLSIKYPAGKSLTVVGKIKGKISERLKGKNGFGYDPIFIPNNKKITFGQMKKSEKIKMDHRYLAFQKLKKKIKI
jgi:XTP/dITP diphosphohydrolase